jgi:hypothetical protein
MNTEKYAVVPPNNLKTKKIVFDQTKNITTTLCNYPMTISIDAIKVLRDEITNWASLVPKEEDTWVAKKYGVPSLLVRADALVSGDMVIGLCEIEDRPCGEYLVSCANEQFTRLMLGFREKIWPPFKGVVAENRSGDISQWLSALTLEEASASSEPLWVCCRPDDEAFHHLVPRAVAPLRFEGIKDYLPDLRLGRSRIITAEHLSSIDWTRQWVFKPCCGTRCLNVLVYWAGLPQRPKDTSSRSRVEKKIQEGGRWIMQEYRYAPSLPQEVQIFLQKENDTKRSYWYIMRLYFAFHPRLGYVPIGGAWNAREDCYALLHGTPDAVFGPVYLPPECVSPM